MKKLCVILMALLGLGLAMPATSLAGKGGKTDATGEKKQDLFSQLDTNGNGTLDKDEREAIRKHFAKKPDGKFKRFDTDNDGKLSDAELDAIKPGMKGKKKNQ